MHAIARFELTPAYGHAPHAGGHLRARDDGRIGRVPGSVLERQFACSAGDLLFTTHGGAYEQTQHVLLVDADLRLRDGLRLEGSAHGGELTGVLAQASDRLTFTFFGNERWQLRVAPTPRLRWPRPLAPSHRLLPPWRPCWLDLQLLA